MGVRRRTFLRLGGLVVATAAVADLDLLGLGEAPAAVADTGSGPARGLFGGPTTLDQTIIPDVRKDTVTLTDYVMLHTEAGEPHLVRLDLSGGAATHPTRGIGAFAQITDLQIVDDKSPGRVEFTDSWADLPNSAGYETDAAYRPQEILSTHLADANIRAVRNIQNGRSIPPSSQASPSSVTCPTCGRCSPETQSPTTRSISSMPATRPARSRPSSTASCTTQWQPTPAAGC
jgi:hypothetical protein